MSNIFDLFKKIERKEDPTPITHIVVGLGNPGDKYTFTRHNAGFLSLDYLCQKLNVPCDRVKFKSLTGECRIGTSRVLLMKPQTFMNNSGEAVKEACTFYKIAPENVIVISDDISLDIGRLRIRKSGSAGGHNGLKSIIEHLGSDSFPRIKVGVGQKPSPDYELTDWVLGKIPKESQQSFFSLISLVPEILELMVANQLDKAMCDYNGVKK